MKIEGNVVCCSVCKSDKITKHNEPGYFHCTNCGGAFVFPLQKLDSYINNTDYLSNIDGYLGFINMDGIKWILDKFEQSFFNNVLEERGELLEIGSALGHFMFLAFSRGWKVEGLETSISAVNYAKKNFKLNVTNKPFEHFETPKKYNAYVMVEVLEHFREYDLFIDFLKKTAAKQSFLFGTTPNIESKHWKEKKNIFEVKDHLFLFSEKAIKILFKKISGHDIDIEYFGGTYNDAHIMYSVIIGNSGIKKLFKNKIENMKPVGEIIKGTIIQQKINLNEDLKNSKLELRLYIATYNRKNSGHLEISIKQGKNVYSELLYVDTLADNAFKKINFNKVNLKKGEVTIEVAGKEGEAGNAITLWSTSDNSNGKCKINNKAQANNLVLIVSSAS